MGDVKRAYEVMGTIKAKVMEGLHSNSMIAELQTRAMAKGAVAIVIEDARTDVNGSTSTISGTAAEKPQYVATQDGKIKKVSSKDSNEYTSTTTTVDTRWEVIEAELWKYQ